MSARLPSRRLTRFASFWAALGLATFAMPMGPASVSGATTALYVPAFTHIYVIVMENKEFGSVVGSTRAPYINFLIRHYGLATNYTAVAHPSEPNYLALWGGSTFGVSDDGVHNITA